MDRDSPPPRASLSLSDLYAVGRFDEWNEERTAGCPAHGCEATCAHVGIFPLGPFGPPWSTLDRRPGEEMGNGMTNGILARAGYRAGLILARFLRRVG
jgi:hypothetical protein